MLYFKIFRSFFSKHTRSHIIPSYWRFKPGRNMNYNLTGKYFLILDFEATCEKDQKIEPQEIIELPCLKVNSFTFEIEAVFHQYIQPTNKLTPFCTHLTGILQEMVDGQPYFKEAFSEFQNWLERENLHKENSIFVTCGDWDFKIMLPDQCRQINCPVPLMMKSWLNIKKSFAAATGYFPRGIMDMLAKLNLPHTGRLHSGIDDCYNIHSILHGLTKRGFMFQRPDQMST